jgi:hypothetical protein
MDGSSIAQTRTGPVLLMVDFTQRSRSSFKEEISLAYLRFHMYVMVTPRAAEGCTPHRCSLQTL